MTMHMSNLWSNSLIRRISANAGDGGGWTQLGMLIPMATKRTSPGVFGSIGIG